MTSEYLLEDIFTETEGTTEIDIKKNEKMLDIYFRKGKKYTLEDLTFIKPEEIPKVKDNEEHLYIDFIELRNFKEILDKAYFDEDFGKYKYFIEDIEKASIYPGEYKLNLYNFNESSTPIYIFCFLIMIVAYILLIIKKYIPFLIIYIIGVLAQFILISDNGFFCKQLKGENLKKLQKILNACPILELYYRKELISKIPFHSYADISGIGFEKDKDFESLKYERIDLINDKIIMKFPIKFVYFVDSTQQYFKFLIKEFYKYCVLKERSYVYLFDKMYLKYSLQTKDNTIIYKNDPFFYTNFTTMNVIKLNILNIFGAFTLLTPIIILFLKKTVKKKLIDIKKTISIKHNLEEYLNLNILFPKFISGKKIIKREIHPVISDRESIQEEFKQNCINIYKKKIEYLNRRKEFERKLYDDDEIERQGYLTPFTMSGEYSQIIHYFSNSQFYYYYGTKVKKIFGKDERDIFRNFFGMIKKANHMRIDKFKENVDYYYNLYDNDGKKKDIYNYNYNYNNSNNLFITDYKSYDNDLDDENNEINETYENNDNYENLKQVIYSEKCLTLTIDISQNFVYVNYSIKLPNNSNKTGKFSLAKRFGGFKELEEKQNEDWTKSEIYIPTCNYIIEIIRKKRSIKISAGDNEIISDTITNVDLHRGAISWTDGDDWDQRTIDKYVKNCSQVSMKNRFQTKFE